ncbi:MAG: NAD(P)-dependent oxidoreductase [Planctomycetota bacterium]|nr:NAD(P)-dependent oxidoreductase [Planctomycetota bacterium]MEA3340151.1 NAD(P)-dependent oxidoreductase [Chloroflexota bacterium]
MKEIALVTSLEYSKAEEVFRSADQGLFEAVPAEESQLAEAVAARGTRAVIVGIEPYVGPLYESLGRNGGQDGSIIVRFGSGHDNVDKKLARRHGIAVANTPDALKQSVAEHTMWLMGSVARAIPKSAAQLAGGQFRANTGIELSGKALGILGLGAIGRRVASIAHFGFGMKVLAAGCLSVAELEQREGMALEQIKDTLGLERYTTEADIVLERSEIVSVHLPLTPQTRHFLDAERLSRMKPGAILVNTARGAIVDENALYDALQSKHLSGAGLDIFETEPYRPTSPDKDLRTLGNAVLTPHIGSNTHEANKRLGYASVRNIVNFLAGRLEEVDRVNTL